MLFIRGRPIPPLFHRLIKVLIDIINYTNRNINSDITINNNPVQLDRAASQGNNVDKDYNLLFHVDRITSY